MLKTVFRHIARWMSVVILLTTILAMLVSEPLKAIDTWWINPMIGVIMFGMGLTMSAGDFHVLLKRPKDVLTGCAVQFVVMPLTALLLTRLFRLPEDIALGVILVGCCPGGTASNVITYLAKGDLALSVGMTACSTLLAPVMTPLLVLALAGATIHVDAVGMLMSILYIVIAPIVAGLLVQRYLPRLTRRVADYLPGFSTLMIALVVAIIVGHTADKLMVGGVVVIVVVMLHNAIGLSLGYVIARALRMSHPKRVALSIEVGMQNSGLASSLAVLHFASYPMAAIPGAVFSVWHNISGALVARWYARPRSQVAIGAILMLHRVDTPDAAGIWYNQHLKMSPRTIEEMAAYAREHKCRFVSLDEMADAIRRKRNVRRLIAVTLDDGYRDNYTNGLSLFRRLNIPYTVYVCTKMVKGEMLYWWDILEHLLLTNGRITLNDGRTFDCAAKEAKEQAFLDIREVILRLPQNDLLSHLRELFSNYSVDYRSGNDRLALTWEQIRELSKEPLATIGNHTCSHLAFSGCSDAEIREDIMRAADEMQEHAGVATRHFAYPFGEASAVSRHDMDLVKTLGFTTSATTNQDYVRYGTDPLELPRLFVTERNWKQVLDGIIAHC